MYEESSVSNTFIHPFQVQVGPRHVTLLMLLSAKIKTIFTTTQTAKANATIFNSSFQTRHTTVFDIQPLDKFESERETYPQVLKFDRTAFQDFTNGLELCGYLLLVDANKPSTYFNMARQAWKATGPASVERRAGAQVFSPVCAHCPIPIYGRKDRDSSCRSFWWKIVSI